MIDDFEMPWSITSAEDLVLDEVFGTNTATMVGMDMGYFLTEDRIFFPGFKDGVEMTCKYIPIPRLLGLDSGDEVEVYMSRLALPAFSRGMAALYGVIEEESYQAATERVALVFQQYFGDLGAMLNKKAPKQYSSFV